MTNPLAGLTLDRVPRTRVASATGALETPRDACTIPPHERDPMTYVVAEPCVKCKYTDSVDVCPVDCFYEG